MAISRKIRLYIKSSSWIRRMFEEGERRKKIYGEEDVFDFSLGNPDIEPSDRFKEIVTGLMKGDTIGMHRYMPNAGLWETRRSIAQFLCCERRAEFKPEDITVTVGAGGGLNIVFKTILDPGDEVVIPKPYFVEYDFYIDNHGGIARKVKTKVDFSLDIDAISDGITSNTKAVIINSPNNPTGRIYKEDEIKGLSEVLMYYSKKLGRPIYLISDEPYRKISYEESVPDIFAYYKEVFLVTSFSKDLSIPGERIGYVAVHPDIQDKAHIIEGLALSNRILGYVNAPALMQRVIPYLLHEPAPVERYKRRRDLFCTALSSFGYEFIWPEGAFYIFPKSPIDDDKRFVSALQDENILTVPGSGFGCPGHFRIAYCTSEKIIERSFDGFEKAIKRFRS